MVREIILYNDLYCCSYAEPYAGGAGLALGLLFDGVVSDIYLNDIDAGIYAFWRAIFNDTGKLISRILHVEISTDEWARQRSVLVDPSADEFDIGFATFFLNRTNRSGIVSGAGPIGGFNQTGSYGIDCRFNRDELAERISRIASYGECIHVTNLDAESFMIQHENPSGETVFFCIDPPYFKKGASLYTNFYNPSDHERVSKTICSLSSPWIVTYDNVKEIRGIYRNFDQYIFDINYSIQTKRVGKEILISSKDLTVPVMERFKLDAA